MKKHTKIYLSAFGYDTTDFIPSEISNHRAVDIHHIEPRGMGGTKEADRIENLMALTREEHIEYGDRTYLKPILYKIHKKFMMLKGVEFDEDYIDQKIKMYD